MDRLGVSFYPHGLSYKAAMTLGKLAEDRGFDGVFVVEGGVNNDAMAMVQAIALATQRITVGTGIANLYLRHPALLGAGAVAIDELSGGRLILGIGVNHARLIETLGLTWRDPRQALRETTAWLRQVFAGATPPGIHTPFRPAQHTIPIHLAGVALETAELAGEIADGLMLYLASKGRFQELVGRLQRGIQRANRTSHPLTVSLLIPTFLSEDFSAARQAARRFLTLYASIPLYTTMFRRSGFLPEVENITQALDRGDQAGVTAAISDRLMDAVCLVGPRSRCREQLAAFREAGVQYPIVAPQAVQEEHAAAVQRFLETFEQG
jgi:alkanesulfonate monooxygenase SsuD/methylene tetrahydromethanopterin reductase-like flavin-dependent oxidoreductase (luciferase family)